MKKILLSGLLAGLAMVVVGVILNTIWQKIFPGLQAEYQTALFRPWSDPIMSLVFVVFIIIIIIAEPQIMMFTFSFCYSLSGPTWTLFKIGNKIYTEIKSKRESLQINHVHKK